VTNLPATGPGHAEPRQPGRRLPLGRLPADGVGLARMEFVVSQPHPHPPDGAGEIRELKDEAAKREIADLTAGYPDKPEYFVDRLSRGIARIAAASTRSR
jgi:pyruvate, water dikinase